METIALQLFFAFVALILCGAIAYEVVQLLASFWDPIVDAWNGPRPKPRWRFRGSQRTKTSSRASKTPSESRQRASASNGHHKPASPADTSSLIGRLSQHANRPDR